MRIAIIFLISVASFCDVSRADLILTLEQSTTGAIERGSEAVFNLFIRSSEATGSITNFGGIDFFVDAADPNGDTTLVAGGQLISGTSPMFADPFQLPFPTSFQYFIGSSAGVGLTVETTDTLLATLTLATTQAKLGDYTISLTGVAAADTGFNNILVSNLSTMERSYSISSVPEPSTFAALVVGICGLCSFTRRRRMETDA